MQLSLLPLCLLSLAILSAEAAGRRKAATTPTRAPAKEVDSDEDTTDECPEPNGFFADAFQCDKYYACTDGKIEEKLCADGLVFSEYDSRIEKCDLPFGIDCSQRPERQKPLSSTNCPRKNGYFAHEDNTICDQFFYCTDGQFNMITCPTGLVFNEKSGICSWPDEAKRKGCSSHDVLQFNCPPVNETEAVKHPRYADPDDCQYFFVCVDGKIPRRSGCKHGQVFNSDTGTCDWPRHVADCKEWYKGILTDEQLALLENPPPRPKSKNTSRQRQRTKAPVVAEEDE